MAFKRFYSRAKKYYYKRGRASRSTRNITTSRSFKASAANMTQNGKFNVSTKFVVTVSIPAGSADVMADVDVPNYLVLSDMHRALSNVFDQYRVEKCGLKFNLLLNQTTSNIGHLCFFTAVDRTGFAAGATVQSIRTYGSYKESVWALNGDTNPPHVVNLGQADMVSRIEYFDSKSKAVFPKVKLGLSLGETQTAAKTFSVTCEIDAQVRYRGVRLDNTGVLARVI